MPDPGRKLARLNALRQSFGDGLPKRVDILWQLWQRLPQESGWQVEHEELLHLAHALAGSAGSFGFRRISEIAKSLENLLSQYALHVEDCPKPTEIQNLLVRLRQLALQQDVATQEPVLPALLLPSTQALIGNVIGVVDDDVALAQDLSTQLSLLGWEVRVYHSAVDVLAALPQLRHAALIVDVMLPEGRLSGVELLARVQALGATPCVMISARWDWESRLAAVQAGAVAYLAKPVDIATLDEHLDRMTHRSDTAPYRVLVVDDDEVLAEHYAQSLNMAGMDAVSLSDAKQSLEYLAEYQSELVLMDLNMPKYSGLEVARVIRQDPQYFSLPIVFLTTESGVDRQQQAMQAGADDFLCKPISDAELLFAVSVRAERFRSLSKLVRQDSMTSLLNHLAFKQRLESELERALRQGKPLVLVMLDIDHFKEVNDRYGHPQGDRVIRTLAHLLRKRLRVSDVVGRYGGEEFAVVMPDTTLPQALPIMDTLRQQFGQMRYSTTQGEFSCSFSAGVATIWSGCDMDNLIQAADQALYQAKHAGRNCLYTF